MWHTLNISLDIFCMLKTTTAARYSVLGSHIFIFSLQDKSGRCRETFRWNQHSVSKIQIKENIGHRFLDEDSYERYKKTNSEDHHESRV